MLLIAFMVFTYWKANFAYSRFFRHASFFYGSAVLGLSADQYSNTPTFTPIDAKKTIILFSGSTVCAFENNIPRSVQTYINTSTPQLTDI